MNLHHSERLDICTCEISVITIVAVALILFCQLCSPWMRNSVANTSCMNADFDYCFASLNYRSWADILTPFWN